MNLGTITLTDNRWIIDTQPHVALKLKRLFEGLQKTGKHLSLPNTPETCADLEWICHRYPMTVQPENALRLGAAGYREVIRILNQIVDVDYVPPTYPMAKPPRPYQAKAAEVCHQQGHLLCADQLGLGKTISAITLLSKEGALPALIVTPAHLQAQWEDQFRAFLPQAKVHTIKSRTIYDLPRGNGLFGSHSADIYIITYAKLAAWDDVFSQFIRTVVFEEAHELRHAGTHKFDSAKRIAVSAAYRLALTATPFYNYGGEIFNVLEVLSPGGLGTIDEFVREWCRFDGKMVLSDPVAFGSYLRTNFRMLDRKRSEVGRELPPVNIVTHVVQHDTRELDKISSSVKTLAKIILEAADWNEKGMATRELDRITRMATGIAKAPYVGDFVRLLLEEEEKVILFGWHREVYSIWKERLKGIPLVMFTGSESAAEKERSKKAFIHGDARVFIVSLRSGSGVDGLQSVCNNLVYGELDWAWGPMDQGIGRAHRDGQEKQVNVFFPVIEAGVDPVMMDILGLKKSQLYGVMNQEAHRPLDEGDRVKRLAEAVLKAS